MACQPEVSSLGHKSPEGKSLARRLLVRAYFESAAKAARLAAIAVYQSKTEKTGDIVELASEAVALTLKAAKAAKLANDHQAAVALKARAASLAETARIAAAAPTLKIFKAVEAARRHNKTVILRPRAIVKTVEVIKLKRVPTMK